MSLDKKQIFYKAISNEIAIDKEVFTRLKIKNKGFIPIRPIKIMGLINKFKIGPRIYNLCAVIFLVLSPFLFFIQLLKVLLKKSQAIDSTKFQNIKNLVLVANNRTINQFDKINQDKACYININQLSSSKYDADIIDFISKQDIFAAYFNAVVSSFKYFFAASKKSNVLQCYVAFEWFLCFFGLEKLRYGENVKFDKVYFSNHYDRWALLFDHVFQHSNIILLQHGLLPEDLSLSSSMENINTIYVLNEPSKGLFEKIYKRVDLDFLSMPSVLNLKNVSEKFSLLVIGQPHSLDFEIELVNKLLEVDVEIYIYVKPHPLYGVEEYNIIPLGSDRIQIITESGFFPKVDIALNYESTLGLEYEKSGIEVIWWKGQEIEYIVESVVEFKSKFSK